MNIFYLHEDPVKAAKLQYNKHVVKMILESAQMLCTAHRCHSLEHEVEWVPYKKHTSITHLQYGQDKVLVIICGYIITC